MNAIGRSQLLCVILVSTTVASVHAGGAASFQGVAAALQAIGQSSAATDAERKQSAEQWLKLARQSLRDGNLDQASKYVERAEKLSVKFDSMLWRFSDTPEKVRRDIAVAQGTGAASKGTVATKPSQQSVAARPGNESVSKQASTTPPANAPRAEIAGRPARLPPIGSARPITGERTANQGKSNSAQPGLSVAQANAKVTAIRLAAQAQAALDRGDLQSARQFVDQAEAIRVPDAAFTEGEIRPWEVGLRVQSAITRRAGVQPAGNFELVPAVGTETGNPLRFPVAQGVYDPSGDSSRNVLVQDQEPTPASELPGEQPAATPGVQLFQQGMTALEGQDRAAALQAFREAWKYERELPPEVRQQLKDKLSLLNQAQQPATSSGTEPSPLEEVASTQHLLYQKLYREISAEEQSAKKLTASDPRGALGKMQALRARVNEAELDAAAKKQLLTFVDRSINGLQTYIEQNRSDIDLNERNQRILDGNARNEQLRFETDDKIAELIDQYNKLIDEERFPEAEVIAKQVRELAPDNPISRTLITKSTLHARLQEQDDIRGRKEKGFYDAMTSVENAAEPFDDRRVIGFGDAKAWKEMTKTRLDKQREGLRRLSPQEIQIQQSLTKQVDVRFTDRPLSEVLETLGSVAGINIHLDPAGLSAEGVTPSTPITLNFAQPIMLKSVLSLILEPLRLGFVIRNEVLMITSEQAKDSNVYVKTYYVADLVVPIPNFVPGYDMGLPAAIREAHQALGYGGMMQPVSTAPLAVAQNSPNGNVGTSASVLAQYAGNSRDQLGARPTNPSGLAPGSRGGAALADFDTLIELIQQTIAPDSWADAGGSGAVESFPTNLSLVISQTQDVHDQITDLLEQLRRLQDLQVAIEVRFITLRDDFYERIGVDFDIEIDDNVQVLRRDDSGPTQAIGLGPTGQPTTNRDIQLFQGSGPGNGSFSLTTPTFGGFGQGAAALNFGVAILSDIETFFLLQAATGDNRTNVLSAPKVTLFNGQAASVADSSQRPFVTSLIPVVGDFAAAQQPVITVLNEGTQLGVQAVVSSDRRFVRLTLVPFFSQIGDVQEFTFTGATTTDTGTNVVDANGQPTGQKDNSVTARTGTTVQLPTFSFTTVSTTVSVPDGGTVLLGGIKRLSEGRNEQGVPMLSQLPYVNRLFKNVGIGRSTSSLMLMVTPRIIIQEEEEEKLGIEVTP